MRGRKLRLSLRLNLILPLVFAVFSNMLYGQNIDTIFSPNGRVLGLKDTIKRTYTELEYYESGELMSLQTLDSNGFFYNEDIVWFDTGDTALFVQFDSTGLLSGNFFSKYKNGHFKSKGTFCQGVLIDKYTEYYENGQRKLQGWYSSSINSYSSIDTLIQLPKNRRSEIRFECHLLVDEILIGGDIPDRVKTYYSFRPEKIMSWMTYDESGKIMKIETY